MLLGAAIATTVGAIDDFRGLLWWQKLRRPGITQRRWPAAFGIYVDRFNFPLLADPFYIELPTWLGVAATIVWVVALMNMVNFLDGMDGLAAGVCGIAGFTFAVIALSLGRDRPRRLLRDRLRGRASASCATTSSRRGSSWATRERCCLGMRSRRSRSRGC